MNTINNRKRNFIICLALISCMMFLNSISHSETTSYRMEVAATVNSNCQINADMIQFGTYDPAHNNVNAGLSAVGNLNIRCTRGTNAAISIDSGSNKGRAQQTSRAMNSSDGSSFLGYDIYVDSGKTMKWDTSNTVKYYAATSYPEKLPVYAYIPEGQEVPDGAYSDVVTVTVMY